jgi:hypothetical protein
MEQNAEAPHHETLLVPVDAPLNSRRLWKLEANVLLASASWA